MQVLLLYNPKSGSKNFHNHLDFVIDSFQIQGMQLIPYKLKNMTLLEQYFKSHVLSGFKKVVIAGGDGTVSQVINVMMKIGLKLPIAIFPTGTANDFSQYFGIPRDIEGMTAIALKENYADCDLGKANDQYFINVASFGNLVDIGQRVNEQTKNILGVLAYYIKGIEEIPKLKSIDATITTDELRITDNIFFALIMNGTSAGGFKRIAPYSDVNDGLLDLVIFKKCPILDLMPLLVQVWNGEHPSSNYIQYVQTKHIIIESNDKIISDLDGEAGPALPLEISVIPSCLKINII